MLFPMEPAEFWSHLKTIIEEVVDQKNGSISKETLVQAIPLKKLLKAKEVCELFQVSKPTIYEWLSRESSNLSRSNQEGIFFGRTLRN